MSSGKQRRLFTLNPVAAAAVRSLAPAGVGLVWVAMASMAQAGPQGGQVTAGQASITQTGAMTTIHQTSARAAIDWQSFNVGAAETVRFQQPSASAVSLNRVLGNDPSAIFGRITANGQVLLLNPNGILFGRSAQVDVGGLVAATANIANADFMAGRLQFSQPGKPGATVVNEGRITVADGGLVALVGRGVSNSGVIQARLGKVALAAGDAFVLDLYGDRLVNLVVEPQLLATLTDSAGVPLAARLDMQGQVMADGGTVQLSAATVQRLVDSVINVSGTVRATSFDALPGRISLRGDSGTRLTLAGTLDTSGTLGGSVSVTAHAVQLADTARVHAGGRHGGGTVEIGGNWQGAGPLPNATDVQVARGARVDASARDTGHGGTVVLWSDGDMRFAGQIDAKGGAAGGDGGRVEVSGKLRLGFDGDVNASAPAGRSGELLLDPTNLIVTRSSGGDTLPGAGTTGDFTVKAAAVNRQLVNGTSVTLQATNDITVEADAVIDGRVASGGAPGGGLTLQADRDISVNGLIILNNGNFAAGAGRQFTQAAGSAIATGTGAIGIVAAGGVLASNLITIGAVDIASSAGGVRITEALGGANGARLASLRVQGQTDVSLLRGALVAGTTQLGSSAGVLDTRTGTLDSTGAVTLTGATALRTGAIVSPAAVVASSGVGPIALGAVAAAAGTVNSSSPRTASLTLRTAGDVSLSGAALGAGGLRVEGATAGQRAGAVDVGAASVFSQGDVQVAAASIRLATQAEAGIQTSGSLSLDASGALASGAGRIESAGAATLRAGQGLVLGIGGLQVTGALRASLSAASEVRIDGALGSAGGAELTSTGAGVVLNRNVNATSFTATAATTFTQGADSAVAAGSGAITITASNGNLSATNLVTTGAVALNAAQGALAVSGALSGASGRLASLQATSRDNLTLNGALVAGTTSLNSTAGTVNTSAATLDSTGAVTLAGATGITAGALVTPAAVLASSTTGAISLGAVAGSAGEVNEQTAAALGLTVKTGGNVTLAGAALGAGGLVVEGATQGSRAGAVALGNASVFSAGAVRVDAASVTLAAAGIKTASTLRLDASGALASGAGRLESSGAATLLAGSSASIGGGGLSVTGNHLGRISATGNVSINGDLQSLGTLHLDSSTGAVGILRNASSTGFTANAATTFSQGDDSTISAGSGLLRITTGTGNLSATKLVGTGDIELESPLAGLAVGNAISGGGSARAASLRVTARDTLTLSGALVSGQTQLTSTLGSIAATAGTLDSTGTVGLASAAGIAVSSIVSQSAVTATSSGGGAISLGAVAGAPGAVTDATARAQGLTVRTTGAVSLAGGALGTGGLRVEGLADGSRAGATEFAIGSLFSTGDVSIKSTGDISFGANAGVATAGALNLDAVGRLISNARSLSAGTTADLVAGTTLQIGTGGATAGGNLTLRSVGALEAAGPVKTSGALLDVRSTAGSVTLDEVFTWEPGVSASGRLQVAAAVDVTMNKPLGGPNTGYLLLADRYQPNLRPQVGAVDISAGRDVELNGLNLDGAPTGRGLQVLAGRNLISNGLIAVNKGDIALRSTSTAGPFEFEGIFLGNSVYSRGLDTATGKTAYSITIGGIGEEALRGNLFLFDNTNDFALVPYVSAFSPGGEIAKVVVANNVENYKRPDPNNAQLMVSDPTLVEATNAAATGVTIGAHALQGLLFSQGSQPGPLRALALQGQRESFSIFSTSLGSASNKRLDGSAGYGISLKIQVHRVNNDLSTSPEAVTGTQLQNVCSGTYQQCGFESVDGSGYDKNDLDPNSDPPGRPRGVNYYASTLYVNIGDPGVVGYRVGGAYNGRAGGFTNLLAARIGLSAPSIVTTFVQSSPYHDPSDPQADPNTGWVTPSDGTMGYLLSGNLTQTVETADARVTRILLSDFVLQTAESAAQFNASGGLNGGNSPVGANSANAGTGANSNPGFAAIGSFGGQGNTSVLPAIGQNPGSIRLGPLAGGSAGLVDPNTSNPGPNFGELRGSTAIGTNGNNSNIGVSFGQLGGGNATGGSGNATGSGVSFGNLQPGSAASSVANSFVLPAAPLPEVAEGGAVLAPRPVDLSIVDGLPTLAELLDFGTRPAAQADLGRGGPSAGVATNVFRKRYLLGRTLDDSVCGGPDLQSAPEAAGKGRKCP